MKLRDYNLFAIESPAQVPRSTCLGFSFDVPCQRQVTCRGFPLSQPGESVVLCGNRQSRLETVKFRLHASLAGVIGNTLWNTGKFLVRVQGERFMGSDGKTSRIVQRGPLVNKACTSPTSELPMEPAHLYDPRSSMVERLGSIPRMLQASIPAGGLLE